MTQIRSFRDLVLLATAVALIAVGGVARADSLIPGPPDVQAKSYVLMDADNGQILVSHDADKERPPASLTKMMTLYIAEKEIKQGVVSPKDMVPISVKAWRTGGSRMFVREGTKVPLGLLMKGVVVDSGNDATVAIAQYLAGSEDAFADMMNKEAKQLGMDHTHYVNPTGLPVPNHYSTAHDLAVLARAIIKDFPNQYSLYKDKTLTFNHITQDNRNLLLFRDPSVDGLKTGHTDAAGYCLVASAKKDGMRLISVVMGTDSDQLRASESQKLLTYGFRFYESYTAYKAGQVLDTPRVWLGDANKVPLGLQKDLVLSIPKGSHGDLKAQMKIQPKLRAPIEKGKQYGTLTVSLNDKVIATRPLVALQQVKEGGFFSRLWDHIVLFFKSLF